MFQTNAGQLKLYVFIWFYFWNVRVTIYIKCTSKQEKFLKNLVKKEKYLCLLHVNFHQFAVVKNRMLI